MFPVKDVMTRNVVTATKDMPIFDAIQLLVDHHITGIPIIDKESNLVGILSEFDVLRILVETSIGRERTVEEFMTKKVIAFEDNVTAIDVCSFFLNDPGKRRVPITHNGKLVGLVSRGDIVKMILKLR